MVGSKPNAYLTEEARLEAQRRMLAERYGLLSDDSDEGETPIADPDDETPANGITNGDTAHQDGQDVNGGDSDPPQDLSASGDGPAPSDAATLGEGSSVHGSDFAIEMPQDGLTAEHLSTSMSDQRLSQQPPSRTSRTETDRAPGWPGVHVCVDTPQGKKIASDFDYNSSSHKDEASKRDLRVSQIAVYNSQYLDKHDRKIAVNDHIITYAVGGHIRAILRSSTVRALLKGHQSTVADVEFLYAQEKPIDPNSGGGISILGSVADDGSVYVWKLIRNSKNDDETLEVSDAIRFEHPDISDGRCYRRIAFRPGPNSIIAENGVGVAMILLDGSSADVRVVELVKMNDKMMVRDKFLKPHKELDGTKDVDRPAPVDAAIWLSERVIVTSRCGKVFLWNADSTLSSCIARLPRVKTTKITSMYALHQDTLLLVVEGGKELEVWFVAGLAAKDVSVSIELRQTIRLFGDAPSDLYTVASVDPHEQLIILSNVKGQSFFVLHLNVEAQAFDAITEVPVKQTILSLCMTRSKRASSSGIGGQVLNSDQEEELGLWCVQPRGIQLIHLPVKDCRPRVPIDPDIYPKSLQRSVIRKPERMIPKPDVPAMMTTSSSGSRESYSEGLPPTQTVPPKRAASATFDTRSSSRSGGTTSVGDSTRPVSRSMPQSPVATPRSTQESQTVSKPEAGKSRQPPPAPSTPPQPVPEPPASVDPGENANEVADNILEAAKKTLAAFDEGAAQRNAADKAKMDRLIDSVTETAKTNLERFVNSSMKKILAETLIPGMSKIIADMRVATKENTKRDYRASVDYFDKALQTAGINKSFTNACQEMERQVASSVSQSLSSKYDAMITPMLNGVGEASEDLTASVALLQKQIGEMKSSASAEGVTEIGIEDIKKTIEEEIQRGNVDGAFQTALDKADLSLVTWLCKKFEVGVFFETHTLSQDTQISLGQQLGHGLSDGDVELKVEWLRELMLVLEPEAEEFDAIVVETLNQLNENVNELRRDKETLQQYDGLEKNLKTLSRLIASQIPST